MSLVKKFKGSLYNIGSTNFGRILLKLFSKFAIKINTLDNTSKLKSPFYILITIDTEPGFLRRDGSRYTNGKDNSTYRGFYYGIRNFRNLANKHKINFTYFILPHFLYSKNPYKNECKNQILAILKERNEIGLHFHPDTDLALQENLNDIIPYRSCKFLKTSEIDKIISTSKEIIKNNLDLDIKSIRWGNYGLMESTFPVLEKNGIFIDSSICAGKSGHLNDKFYYNWCHRKSQNPYYIGQVLEVPVSTFLFFRKRLCVDPAMSVLLLESFKKFYEKANRPFFLNVITHSYEGTDFKGNNTKVINELDTFIKYAKQFKDIKFITISQVKNEISI